MLEFGTIGPSTQDPGIQGTQSLVWMALQQYHCACVNLWLKAVSNLTCRSTVMFPCWICVIEGGKRLCRWLGKRLREICQDFFQLCAANCHLLTRAANKWPSWPLLLTLSGVLGPPISYFLSTSCRPCAGNTSKYCHNLTPKPTSVNCEALSR